MGMIVPDIAYKHTQSRRKRFSHWIKQRHKGPDPFELHQLSDTEEDDDDHFSCGLVHPLDEDSCSVSNEFRIFVGTWNVAGRSPDRSLAVDLDEWLNVKEAADIYVLGFQEIVPLKTRNVLGTEDLTPATKWNSIIEETLNNKYKCPWVPGYSARHLSCGVETPTRDQTQQELEEQKGYSTYKLLASKKMVGVFISVWMKNDLVRKYCVSDVKVCSVACGIMGYLGNKGSVSVSMSIEGTSFCFIAAHLASGEKNGDEVRRNYQVSEIFRRTSFPRLHEDVDKPHPLTILGHDQIFWLGDLNYRLYLEDNLARLLIKTKDWKSLQEFDQLRKEQVHGGVFEGWREGNIGFAPTYKYSTSNRNQYSGGLPAKSGEKQRTPAWCDRILWYGKDVKQLSYFRSESKFSDHRPVSSLFSTQIEVLSSAVNPVAVTLPTILLNFLTQNNKNDGSNGGEDKNQEVEAKPSLLALMVQDIESPSSLLSPVKSVKMTSINALALDIVDH